jgi:hypothetical protein
MLAPSTNPSLFPESDVIIGYSLLTGGFASSLNVPSQQGGSPSQLVCCLSDRQQCAKKPTSAITM